MYVPGNFFNIKSFLVILFVLSQNSHSDNFRFNTFNNHGSIGLINMPSARFFEESSNGVTIYDGSPDQKITLTSFPFEWLEASFFYTNINGKPYCEILSDPVCQQDYKDKGFNFKVRLKEEDKWPAIAVGINDIAGTGLYSSEYIVGSYGLGKIDLHFGLGWGNLNGAQRTFKNPFSYIHDNFQNRPSEWGEGGQFEPSRYFSGSSVSPFLGISYAVSDKFIIKYESDTLVTPGRVGYEESKENYSYGFNYIFSENFNLGLSMERGNSLTLKLVFKNNPKTSLKQYQYKKLDYQSNDTKYDKLIKNLENNGIGVNKIYESASTIGIELTQFIHPNIQLIDKIIDESVKDSGIKKNVKKDLKIANLNAVKEIDSQTQNDSKVVYQRKKQKTFNTSTRIKFRPFLASREDFFKGSLLLENDSEFVIRDDLFFNTNIKYSLYDNFDDLTIPPRDVFPEQVRSDIKDYLRNIDEGILIGRAQLDYHLNLKKNHFMMFSGGILEDMYIGYGFEYLYFRPDTNYAFGFELFDVQKRDYKWSFGTLGYKNTTGLFNYYHRNYGSIPFDMKLSVGEYLAGDIGATIEFSRQFRNGTEFGIFATFTDVTSEEFGEGSFDKGIFFNIPVYGNFINYTWRPLTKDPGAKLNRRHDLYNLLVKFRPIND